MPTQIELYQEMSAFSARMVEAAQANDWERLIAIEKSVAALRATLMAEEGGNSPGVEELELKAALIRRILDDDAEIRRHTEPWMESVRQFLGGAGKRSQVERAYGASS